MIPLCRTASSTKAELDVRPCDNETTRQHDWSPVVGGQLPGSPAAVDPPNNRQRITASRGEATISAFQRLPRRSSTKAGFSLLAFSTSAFTLIELTVVILIIATLVGLVVTGISSTFDHAKKAQAKNDETQIVTAVNAYYTEYGKYPMADARQGADTLYGKSNTAPGNEDVFNVLRAIATGVNAGDVLNPRKIVFFSGKDGGSRPRSAFASIATTDTQGKPINIGAFVDPYGNAYMIAIDGSYDGATVDPSPYTDLTYATGNTVRVGCFAESFGKDGVQGRKQSNGTGDKKYSGSDDVLSWQ